MADEVTAPMLKALRNAAARERGNICPIAGLHAAAETQLLAALDRRGLITWNGAVPRISDAGRLTVRRYEERAGHG